MTYKSIFYVYLYTRMSLKELCAYETPSVAELEEFLLADRRPTGHVNQVWPNVYIGNEYVPGSRPTIHEANAQRNRLTTQLNIQYII